METCFLFRIFKLISSVLPTCFVSAGIVGDINRGIGGFICAWAEDSVGTAMAELTSVGDAMCEIFAMKDSSGLGMAVNEIEGRVVSTLITSGSGIGMVICFACWLFAVLDLIIQDRISPETFIKSTARLGLGFALCASAEPIYSGIREFGNSWGDWVLTAFGGENEIELSIDFSELEGLADNWLILAMNVLMFNTVVLVCAGAMKICAYIVQITRVLEMIIRGSFLGVAFGMTADDGWRGPAGRYIKKFIAICCQGGVLILLGNTTAYLQCQLINEAFRSIGAFNLDNMGTYWSATFIAIGVGFAGLSMMFKSLGFVNDLFGA